MYEQDRQSKVIECLTKYLQYFKTYFSLVYSLIECHVFPNKFNHVQLENATQKLTNKKFSISFEQSPFSLWIHENSKSYVDRFYMRIVEFLEYRLNIFRGQDSDQKLTVIINNFISNLHKFFKTLTLKQIQRNQRNIVIGQVFFEIQELVKKLIFSTFDHLEKIHSKNTVILQQIKFSRELINEQVLRAFYNILEQLQHQQSTVYYPNERDNFSNETYENSIAIPKSRSKSDFAIQNFYSVESKYLRENRFGNQNSFVNLRRLYPNAMEIKLQKSESLTKKSTYAQLLSVMDIEDIEVYSRDYIMEELQRKNAINKRMIKKYLQVYKRKNKKHKKRLNLSPESEKHQDIKTSPLKDEIYNYQAKSKSELNITINLDKISMIPIIKENSIFTQNLKESGALKKQKLPKNLTQGGISNALYFSEDKKETKSRIENIRQEIIKKSVTVNQNPELETNRETFAYRQKEKLYFQSLKNKMNFQNQKTSEKIDSIRSQNEAIVKKLNKISAPAIIETSTDEYRKMFRSNMKKNNLKGSSFLPNKAEEKINPSKSDIFSKNDLTFKSIETKLVSLEGSSLSKRMPKRGKLRNFLQNEDMINSTIMHDTSKVQTNNIGKINNLSYVEPQSSVLVLPRIPSNKKQVNFQS